MFFLLLAVAALYQRAFGLVRAMGEAEEAGLLPPSPSCVDSVASSRLEAAFLKLNPLKEKPNAVFSPFSLLAVLAALSEGSSGATREALLRFMGDPLCYCLPPSALPPALNSSSQLEALRQELGPEEAPALAVLSQIYVEGSGEMAETNEIFAAFKERVERRHPPASVSAFEGQDHVSLAAEMNAVVKETTRGRIPSLVSPLDLVGARLVLLNAVYFKGHWGSPFLEEETIKAPFFAISSSGLVAKETPFIQQTLEPHDAYFFREEKEGVDVVGLQYDFPNVWLFLYQPADLGAFERRLTTDARLLSRLSGLARTEGGPSSHPRRLLRLSLPKFRLAAGNNKLDAGELLPLLGLGSCQRGQGGFEKINGDSRLRLSVFRHQAEISIDEKGTEAAAATFGVVTDGPASRDTYLETVSFNRPFLFEIRLRRDEEASAKEDFILFAGRFGDPEPPENQTQP